MDIRERIVEVLTKYNVKLEDAPLDALTMAMDRMCGSRSLLRAVSKPSPMPTDPVEFAKRSRENADYHRDVLKPFA